MADVLTKAIAANPYRSDAAVVGAKVTGYYAVDRGDYGVFVEMSGVETKLTTRFDNPRFYSGDNAS